MNLKFSYIQLRLILQVQIKLQIYLNWVDQFKYVAMNFILTKEPKNIGKNNNEIPCAIKVLPTQLWKKSLQNFYG